MTMRAPSSITKLRKSVAGWGNDEAVLFFRLLGDTMRFNIVRLLFRNKDLCPTELSRILGVSVPAISYQCRILALAEIVRKEKHGKTVCFRLNEDHPYFYMLKGMF